VSSAKLYKEAIPWAFFAGFMLELGREFGDDIFEKNEDEGYAVYYLCGTAGWHDAFERTCDNLGLNTLWKTYDGLPWYESDELDSWIADRIIETCEGDPVPAISESYKWLLEGGV